MPIIFFTQIIMLHFRITNMKVIIKMSTRVSMQPFKLMFMHILLYSLIELTSLRTRQQNHVPFYQLIWVYFVFFKGDSINIVLLPCFLLEYKIGPDRKGWNHSILVQRSWPWCKFHL